MSSASNCIQCHIAQRQQPSVCLSLSHSLSLSLSPLLFLFAYFLWRVTLLVFWAVGAAAAAAATAVRALRCVRCVRQSESAAGHHLMHSLLFFLAFALRFGCIEIFSFFSVFFFGAIYYMARDFLIGLLTRLKLCERWQVRGI